MVPLVLTVVFAAGSAAQSPLQRFRTEDASAPLSDATPLVPAWVLAEAQCSDEVFVRYDAEMIDERLPGSCESAELLMMIRSEGARMIRGSEFSK